MFPFVFPPGYPFSPAVLSQGSATATAAAAAAHTPTGHSSAMATHSNHNGNNNGGHSLGQKRSTTLRYVDSNLKICVF